MICQNQMHYRSCLVLHNDGNCSYAKDICPDCGKKRYDLFSTGTISIKELFPPEKCVSFNLNGKTLTFDFLGKELVVESDLPLSNSAQLFIDEMKKYWEQQ